MLKSIDHQKGEMMKKNMLLTKNYTERLMILGLYVLAIYLRYTLFSLHTSDYDADFSGWYDFIQSHGGFAALKYNFSNYNVSYFYLLTLGTYLPVPKMSMIKVIPVCFDTVMALFIYLIVRLKYQRSYLPIIASLVILFTPTVFIMSGYWGQFESIYASLAIGGLYFFFRKEPLWACVFFGLAVSFKPQPIFLFPLLFVLVITGELPKKYILIIPLVYLMTVLPACLIGRGFIDVLTTYRSRADNPGQLLTLNAPTIFQWLPTGPFAPWDTAGFILALSAVGIIGLVVLTSRRRITNEIMLKVALVFVLLVPFLMPEMHERYFYLADIISFIYAFYFPKYFYVAILVELSSLMSYSPYLEGSAVIDLKYIALLLLGVIILTILDLVKTLFSTNDQGLEPWHPSQMKSGTGTFPLSMDTGSHLSLDQPNREVAEDPDDASSPETQTLAQDTSFDPASDSISFDLPTSWDGSLLGRYKEGLKNIPRLLSKNTIALQDILVFCLLAGLLFYGTFTDNPTGDPSLYQCYAIAFWHGWSAFENLGLSGQCGYLVNPDQNVMILHALQQWGLPSGLIQFAAAQSSNMPYHALPQEYPLLSILPFSLGLQTLSDSYRVNFALWMIVFARCIYLVLLHWRSRQAAYAYCLYLVLAGWMTAAGRFDIIPAGLTLFAVICAQQKRWNWAFACLALATLTKMYPAILLVPFLLALQRETPGRWYAWRRWLPMGVFMGICLLVIGVSLLLNVAGTLAPLGYFVDRPAEIESLPASIFWIASVLWKTPLTYTFSFGSSNLLSPLFTHVIPVMNIMQAIGLLFIWWLQRRGRIGLGMACLLTLLIILMTGKVFSTQYLIWVIPLVAYVEQSHRWWLFSWTLIAFFSSWTLIMHLTSSIYPSITVLLATPLFSTIRNILLLGFLLATLVSRSLRRDPHSHEKEQLRWQFRGMGGQWKRSLSNRANALLAERGIMPGRHFLSTIMKRSTGIGKPHDVVSSKTDTKGRSSYPNGSRLIAFLLFLGNVVLQSWTLKTQARPDTDEGVYLYQAKLITQGYLPYKDFAMTNHVPFLMYLNALVLKLCDFDMVTYHRIYVIWVFLTIFPLFYTVLYFTRSRVASILSCVFFSTFTELVQWDAHFFAIRQASLPLFACFIYFFFVKKKAKLSHIFLALFSFCLITNFIISLAFVITVFAYGCTKHRRSRGQWAKKYAWTSWVFVLLTGTYFGLIALIPGSIHNFLITQNRISFDLQKVGAVKDMMPSNWPIFLFGALGIFFFLEEFFLLSLLSYFTLIITVFVNGSFYSHYVTPIAVPFAIMGGIFLHKLLLLVSLNERKIAVVRKLALVGLIFFALYQTVYSSLSQALVFDTTPDFFRTVHVLEQAPEPLFTLQPIYALYAQKDLVMYYNTADMRVLSATGTNLSDEQYHDIIEKSNTVLLESFANQMLPPEIKEEIFQNFSLTYSDGTESVYVRKIVARTSTSYTPSKRTAMKANKVVT